MAMTPAYALAHVFLPNLIKLRGHAVVVNAIERKNLAFFDSLWTQAHVSHTPHVTSQMRDPYRIVTISLPPPKEMGEAYLAGLVIKPSDPQFMHYYTLEHDFVLAKQANRTLWCERAGAKHTRIGDGPVLTGDPDADARAFVDLFMEPFLPTKVTRK
jgi:hypothetical protein